MKNIMKKALITGANKGIGYEIARHLGKAGWQVIIGARDEERAKKAMETLKADGVKLWIGNMSICLTTKQLRFLLMKLVISIPTCLYWSIMRVFLAIWQYQAMSRR